MATKSIVPVSNEHVNTALLSMSPVASDIHVSSSTYGVLSLVCIVESLSPFTVFVWQSDSILPMHQLVECIEGVYTCPVVLWCDCVAQIWRSGTLVRTLNGVMCADTATEEKTIEQAWEELQAVPSYVERPNKDEEDK